MTRVLADFEGRWQIARHIIHAGAPPASFEGQGTWTRDGAGLAYHEVGALHITGHAPMQSEQRYHWDADLNVTFGDGRFFHTVPAHGGETQHWCDPDRYDVSYDFEAWPTWEVTWQVQGPRKNYRMISRYQKR